MNKFFPTTYMMLDARHCPKRRGLIFELFVFYFAYWVIKMIEGLVAAIPQTLYFMQDPSFLALMEPDRLETLTMAEFTAVFAEVAARMPSTVVLYSLLATAVTVAGSIFVCLKLEKRNLSSMGIRRRGALAEYLVGLVAGAGLFALAVLIAHLSGAVTVAQNPDANPGLIALFFLAFMVQALSEELLCRGYLMMTFARTASPVASVLTSALVFAALHSGNVAITPLAFLNIFLVGILFGAYVLKRGSIWGAAAMHASWNFLQGNVFGIPVSGMTMDISVFEVTLSPVKHHVNGGAFGLEGGLAVTIVLLLAIGLVLPLRAKASELAPAPRAEEAPGQ